MDRREEKVSIASHLPAKSLELESMDWIDASLDKMTHASSGR